MIVATIGFTKKSAEEFFALLKRGDVRTLVDIRLNPNSQLAGFVQGRDLPYFLRGLVGAEYLHLPDLAPSKALPICRPRRVYPRPFDQAAGGVPRVAHVRGVRVRCGRRQAPTKDLWPGPLACR